MSRYPRGLFSSATPRRGRLLAAVVAVCALAALLASVGASATKVEKTTVILGQTSQTPDPSCPGKGCQAIGSTTGFQVSNGQAVNPFLVKHAGTIKSWTLTLAQPTPSERKYFNDFFGTPPEARLAILRRVAGTNPPRYTLRANGALKVLSPYLGQTVKFGSNLKVKRNDIVAISVPTWAPAFAEDLAANNVWRASRAPDACVEQVDLRQGEPQEKVGRNATYGCKYATARLLYTATLVED